MSHQIVHVELSAENNLEAAKWYAKVFGWEYQDFPEMDYTTFTSGEDGIGGGFNPVSDENPAGTVVVYIGTEDIYATVKNIEANGGVTVVPPTEIPYTGTFSFFKDPTGNIVGVFQGLPEETG